MPLGRITIVCFAASYGVALGLELIQLGWPRPIYRVVCALFASAGLLAHTLYLLVQRPSLASQFGLLLFLGWILAVYYLAGSLHHRRQARGIFVLPVLLGLTILAGLTGPGTGTVTKDMEADALPGELFWGYLHAGFLLLAADRFGARLHRFRFGGAIGLPHQRRVVLERLGGFRAVGSQSLLPDAQ